MRQPWVPAECLSCWDLGRRHTFICINLCEVIVVPTDQVTCVLFQPPEEEAFSGSDGKESTCNEGDLGSIPGSGKEWQPTPVFLPGESLAGPNPQSHKESDMTE